MAFADTWSDIFLAKALAMIVFGAAHGIGLLLLVGCGIKVIVGAIVSFLVYSFFSGSCAADSTSSYTTSYLDSCRIPEQMQGSSFQTNYTFSSLNVQKNIAYYK